MSPGAEDAHHSPDESTTSLTPIKYNRPIYSFTAPAIIEQTVFGENLSGAQAGVNRSRWAMQLGAKYTF